MRASKTKAARRRLREIFKSQTKSWALNKPRPACRGALLPFRLFASAFRTNLRSSRSSIICSARDFVFKFRFAVSHLCSIVPSKVPCSAKRRKGNVSPDVNYKARFRSRNKSFVATRLQKPGPAVPPGALAEIATRDFKTGHFHAEVNGDQRITNPHQNRAGPPPV